MAANSGLQRLHDLSESGLISSHTWRSIKPMLEQRMDALVGSVQEALSASPALEAEEFETARQEMLRAQRSMLSNMRSSGTISDETFDELVAEVDHALSSDRESWGKYAQRDLDEEICELLVAVVQSRDLESASNGLAIRGIQVTRIQSHGGFLRKRNHVLLMGIAPGRLRVAMDTLERVCQERVAYVSPLDLGKEGLDGETLPVLIKGATTLVFDVERCEVIQ
jgi:uncharacterized protein YaaQ